MLPRLALPPVRTGPLPRIQFAVELVGPHTVAMPLALRLLDPDWMGALGGPVVWGMAQSDSTWRLLLGHTATSVDSLALCWDLVTPRGSMTTDAATRLLKLSEEFGSAIGRRAMPLFPPDEVGSRAIAAGRLIERMDAGVVVQVLFPSPVKVARLETWLLSEGFVDDLEGGLMWQVGAHPPLLTATPLADVPSFDVATEAAGLTFGYRLPLCPEPEIALDQAVRLAGEAIRTHGGHLIDEDGQPLVVGRLQLELKGILDAMRAAKLDPGGAECLRLFRN